MTRVLWIVGLSITVFVFGGAALLCIVAFITHRHLNMKGWTVLVLSAYSTYFMFRLLRSAIRYGEPTKGLSHHSSG
jgi:hypothetical protein